MSEETKLTLMFAAALIVGLLAGFVVGGAIGMKMHSGFCPKCGEWYSDEYYYCQMDGEKLLRPSENSHD